MYTNDNRYKCIWSFSLIESTTQGSILYDFVVFPNRPSIPVGKSKTSRGVVRNTLTNTDFKTRLLGPCATSPRESNPSSPCSSNASSMTSEKSYVTPRNTVSASIMGRKIIIWRRPIITQWPDKSISEPLNYILIISRTCLSRFVKEGSICVCLGRKWRRWAGRQTARTFQSYWSSRKLVPTSGWPCRWESTCLYFQYTMTSRWTSWRLKITNNSTVYLAVCFG